MTKPVGLKNWPKLPHICEVKGTCVAGWKKFMEHVLFLQQNFLK